MSSLRYLHDNTIKLPMDIFFIIIYYITEDINLLYIKIDKF
jgi:hypothetical protein